MHSQATQILKSFRVMLDAVGSDLGHVLHVNVFLKDMRDFEDMNRVYAEQLGDNPNRPGRS